MAVRIRAKEATAIINSLSGGVVPRIGIQHITVGRKLEVEAFTHALDEVKRGHSMCKFWIGEFGSGKSFMLHLLNTVAMKQKFVVSNADFTPDNRLYATDGKSVLLYTAIMENLAIQTKPEGGALPSLLDKWIEQEMSETALQHQIPLMEIRNAEHLPLIQDRLMKKVSEVTESGGFDFATVVIKYYEAFISGEEQQRRYALKWLKGEYTTKTEARQDLGVREIINDSNYYDMLKNFCRLFVSMGYSGFMINLDEAINLYKISTRPSREKNYEKVLSIFNDCYQGKVSNLFINFAGTNDFLENPRRGLFSYDALKTRLESNKFETLEYRDFTQPVIKLKPLNHEEIFVLLKKLKEIFDFNYGTQIDVTDNDLEMFMEDLLSKPGAEEFLTPRDVIRNFIQILSLLRQNPQADKKDLISDLKVEDERPEKGNWDALDAITEI